jgi:hypothetical protein
MKNIAVRLWNNQMLGTTYGKSLRRQAYFNGTIQIAIPPVKYLIDLEPIPSWFHHAKSPIHLKMLKDFNIQPVNDPNVLMSWIVRYEGGVKTPVDGLCHFELSDNKIFIRIKDQASRIEEEWQLDVKTCLNRTPGKPTPNLIATNYELEKVSV